MDTSKSGQTVDRILDYIIANGLKPGDRLPSEEELTRLFGVSRVSVREGLHGLKFLGLLKSTTSRGTVIREMDFGILARCLGFQIAVSEVSYRQLLEARLAVECGALELICGKLAPEQLAELRRLADCRRRDDSEEEVRRDHCSDRAFHQYLLACGGNEVLTVFSRLLGIFFDRVVDAGGNPAATGDHEMLIDALEHGNLELARGIMRRHLAGYYRLIAQS